MIGTSHANRIPSWSDLAPVLSHISDNSTPLELYILKSHLVIEAAMYRLLSIRLGIAEDQLPPLQYFPLSKLAFGGDSYRSTLWKVLALNDLRNEFSHELNAAQLEPGLRKICKQVRIILAGR
jgi:hypothetical protein